MKSPIALTAHAAPSVPMRGPGLDTVPVSDRGRFAEFGGGPVVDPPHVLIDDAFVDWARRQPEQVALTHGDRSMTYDELERASRTLASVLDAHGVGPGEHVCLFMRRGPELVTGILGTLRAGAAYVPQDAKVATASTLEHVVTATKARVVLTTSEWASAIPQIDGVAVLCLDELDLSDEPTTAASDRTPDDVAFVLFTSGTTGTPNGVRVTHRNVCNIVLTEPGNLGMAPGKVVAQLLSISFDMAAWEMLGALGNGATLRIRGESMQEAASGANIVIATPSVLDSIDPALCPKIETAAVAGEPCPVPLAEAWSSVARFYNSCGPTETTIINTAQEYRPGGPLTIGRPTPNNTVYVLDDDLQPLPIGEVGEMWAGGDCVTSGYLDNTELTDERYRPDPFMGEGRMMFRTRDLGRWTESGELEHHGRTDDQVKVRGFRVELDSVSTALEDVDGCTKAVTLKLDDRHLVSFVQPSTVDPEVARAGVIDRLPYYAVPVGIYAMDELPRTSRGKVDKRLLLELAAADAPALDPTVDDGPITVDDSEAPVPFDPEAHHRIEMPEPQRGIRGALKGPRLMHHNRLAGTIGLINLVVLVAAIARGWWSSDHIALEGLAIVATANFTVGILFRQQYVINAIFLSATSAPTTWPLRLRALLAKVYHVFGGVHIGAVVSGTVWFAILLGSLFAARITDAATVSTASIAVAIATIALLLTIIALALPRMRAKHHDLFERSHRFGGWTVLALFWIQIALTLRDLEANGGDGSLLGSPLFWMVALVTFGIVLPWLRLRKVDVDIVRPSDHVALVRFGHGVTPFAGSSTTVSRSPLMEWHSFANVPAPGESGFRLTISRAGDWTGQLIDETPDTVWVRGIPTAGVGNIDRLFTKVVWVATGSGIGPTLPHLLSQETPSHLVWATRNPRKTYGDGLVDEILAVSPGAEIWDTDAYGKPDLVKLAWDAVQRTGAEAVICIANKPLTWKVVEGLERVGVPAYGAIFDS